jgi:hypothetical protein
LIESGTETPLASKGCPDEERKNGDKRKTL